MPALRNLTHARCLSFNKLSALLALIYSLVGESELSGLFEATSAVTWGASEILVAVVDSAALATLPTIKTGIKKHRRIAIKTQHTEMTEPMMMGFLCFVKQLYFLMNWSTSPAVDRGAAGATFWFSVAVTSASASFFSVPKWGSLLDLNVRPWAYVSRMPASLFSFNWDSDAGWVVTDTFFSSVEVIIKI